MKRVRGALGDERGQTRLAHVLSTGGLMSPQDENTIRLEGRFVGHGEAASLTLKCSAVAFREAEYSTRTGADGSAMRSMVVEPALLALGVPSDFDRYRKGNWTHIVCSQIPGDEAELRGVFPLDGDGARFTLRLGG
jgi:hypothetical protein